MIAGLIAGVGWAQPGCTGSTVLTTAGAVCGSALEYEGAALERFLGIPYAETTGGENRFAPPVPKSPWSGVLEATAFGDICPQNEDFEGLAQSEDCLSVNVWRPASASESAPRPVLVFIHGGAFVIGSSADPLVRGSGLALYDGSHLAASENLVVVTFNYRLGALGFLAGVAGLEGNFGLLDQQLALEWVQENIGAFGGNPNTVTLAGESAGAMSVGLHLNAVPSSDALVDAAIMQSNPLGLPYPSLEDATSVGELFLLGLGCQFRADQLGCLRAQALPELLEAQRGRLLRLTVLDFGLAGFLTWTPVVDGQLVQRQPFAGRSDKPVLLGTNAREGTVFFGAPKARPIGRLAYATFIRTLFGPENLGRVRGAYPNATDNTERVIEIAGDYLFTCANRAFARGLERAYLYTFEHVPSFNIHAEIPRCAEESCHADELAFVFRSAGAPRAFTEDEDLLSRRMARYWGRFAGGLHTPNPGLPTTPAWPPFGEGGSYLTFDLTPELRSDAPERCAFWDALGYDLRLHDRRD